MTGLCGERDPNKSPWDPSCFRYQAPVAGIAFEFDERVPEGLALLACAAQAACVIVSEITADALGTTDDSALWRAMAALGTQSHPALVRLPAFGGDGSLDPITPHHPLQPLAEYAASRSRSFEAGADDGRFGLLIGETELDPRFFGPDFYPAHMAAEPDSIQRNTQGYYRRFLIDRAEKIPWIDELRAEVIARIASDVVDRTEMVRRNGLRVEPRRLYPAVVNDEGGRIAQVHPDVGRPPRDFLVLADECDRPAAIEVLASAGREFPFAPIPGWLNAAIRPGRSGWVYVRWTGNVAGLEVELELARLRSLSGRLTVFAAEFAKPIEILLSRAGLEIKATRIEVHPADPECLFGVDLFASETARGPRRLRPHAKQLVPAEWVELLEKAWNPESSSLEVPTSIASPAVKCADTTAAAEIGGCRLCDSASEIQNQRLPFPVDGYCIECCRDAYWGAFNDEGSDEPWNEAVVWALQTLAQVEFGGAPAQGQVNSPPAEGPNSDLLFLCRMLVPRRGEAPLGAHRRAYSWTEWLAKAGLLADGVRRSRGTVVTAKDGHLCRSMLERVIDDFLSDHGIAHELEPMYPMDPELNRNGLRADWKLGDGTFVEALGFPNLDSYVEKVERKIELAARYEIPLIGITEADLGELSEIFKDWLGRPME